MKKEIDRNYYEQLSKSKGYRNFSIMVLEFDSLDLLQLPWSHWMHDQDQRSTEEIDIFRELSWKAND